MHARPPRRARPRHRQRPLDTQAGARPDLQQRYIDRLHERRGLQDGHVRRGPRSGRDRDGRHGSERVVRLREHGRMLHLPVDRRRGLDPQGRCRDRRRRLEDARRSARAVRRVRQRRIDRVPELGRLRFRHWPCVAPSFHHDFGFLNGPLVVHADDGLGGTRELVVSGSKDGSLYARDPSNGSEVWTRAVAPKPVTPAFAGFGLFNGGVGFVANHFVAALNDFVPTLTSPPEHWMAFNPVDGSTTWQDEIGASWGSIGAGGGLVVVGTNATNGRYGYDATNGTRLATLPMPDVVSSGASIVDGTIYVGYGIFGSTGGVRAFGCPLR